MNNQNNFNSYNSNSNNSPKPVKNKFFNMDMFNEADMNQVGSSTSNYASNQAANWNSYNQNDVGSNMVSSADFIKNYNDEQKKMEEAAEAPQITSMFSQDLLKDVNSVVYTDTQPEVLDSDFLDVYPNNVNDNTLFGYTDNEVLDTDDNQEVLDMPEMVNDHGVMPAASPIFNQNVGVDDPNAHSLIDNNLIAQQPLSMNSLGAEADMNNVPDVVDDNSRFFQTNNPNIQNNMNMNNAAPMQPVAPVTEIFADEVNLIDETALAKAYIGPKYQKIYMSNFSLSAMLFGSLAFFYRKMYIIGILIFMFQAGILYFFREMPYIILAAFGILALIMGLIYNPIFLAKARKQAKYVKKHFPKVSQGELNHLIGKRGKRNPLIALLLQCILLGGAAYLAIYLLGTDYFVDTYKDVKAYFVKKMDKPVVIKYDGDVNYSDINIEDYFTIELSPEYVKENKYYFNYIYVTEGEGDNNACEVTFGFVNDFTSPKDMITKMASYYEIDGDIETSDSDDLKWYLLTREDVTGKTNYRATLVDDKVVMFEFKSGINTPENVCDTQIVNILDSIELK